MQKGRISTLIKSEAGLGLVEILVSLTLLLIITSSFSNMIINGSNISQKSKLQNTAQALAQDKMEEIKAAWPKDITDFSKVYGTNGSPEDVQMNGTKYTRTWTASPVDAVTYPDPTPPDPTNPVASNPKYLFRVTVTVGWDEYTNSGSVPKSLAVISYITGR